MTVVCGVLHEDHQGYGRCDVGVLFGVAPGRSGPSAETRDGAWSGLLGSGRTGA
jgi:hypothetical protein